MNLRTVRSPNVQTVSALECHREKWVVELCIETSNVPLTVASFTCSGLCFSMFCVLEVHCVIDVHGLLEVFVHLSIEFLSDIKSVQMLSFKLELL